MAPSPCNRAKGGAKTSYLYPLPSTETQPSALPAATRAVDEPALARSATSPQHARWWRRGRRRRRRRRLWRTRVRQAGGRRRPVEWEGGRRGGGWSTGRAYCMDMHMVMHVPMQCPCAEFIHSRANVYRCLPSYALGVGGGGRGGALLIRPELEADVPAEEIERPGRSPTPCGPSLSKCLTSSAI